MNVAKHLETPPSLRLNMTDLISYPLNFTFTEVVRAPIKIHVESHAEMTESLIACETGISCAGGLLT